MRVAMGLLIVIPCAVIARPLVPKWDTFMLVMVHL